MSEISIISSLQTRKKCVEHLHILIDALDKIDPKIQMDEIQRIIEKMNLLIEDYKESTISFSPDTPFSEDQLNLIKKQEIQWQDFLKKLKNFNFKFKNKYIEYKKLIQKFKNQDQIRNTYLN